MSLLDVVFRVLNKDGDAFIEPRREDGHGSSDANPTHVDDGHPDPQQDALTDTQLRASAVPVSGTLSAQQDGSWTVALDAASLAALETISVENEVEVTLNGESIAVTGTVAATQSGSWEVALDSASLAALEAVTVQQGTSPWVVSGAVTVSNPTADPETGLAKEATLQSIDTELATQQKDALTDAELRASDVDIADSGEREYSPGITSQIVTASGPTTIYTAPSGTAFRIRMMKAIPVLRGSEEDPVVTIEVQDSVGTPTVTINDNAIQLRKLITGPTEGKIVVSLDIASRVPVWFDIEEFTP